MNKTVKNTINILLILALFGLVIFTDKFSTNAQLLVVLKKGAIYALVAVSMNLLNGFTGLFSLGQAGFMLLGAYTYAIFTIPLEFRDAVYLYYDGGIIKFTMPMLAAMLLGGVVAAIFAYLIALPVLKLQSDYLAIATLGFAEILRAIVQWDKLGIITNGSNLLKRFPKFDTTLPYFIVVAVCIAVIVMLIRSTYGRAFKAIRDDEIAAEAMGINLAHHKRLSFVISSFFAGIGGALLAMYQTTIQANAFKSAMTYEILLIVVIGGIGSVTGSVIASFLFIACSEWWLRFLDSAGPIRIAFGNTAISFNCPLFKSGFRMVVFSIVIMIIVLFFRRGIMGEREFSVEGIYKWFKKRFSGKKNVGEAKVK